MTKRDKILLVISAVLIVFISIGGYLLLKDDKKNEKETSSSSIEEDIVIDEPPVLYLNNLIEKINLTNKLLISDKISEADYKEDEKTHKKYYKYTGEAADSYAMNIISSYIKYNNDYFLIVPKDDNIKTYELYIAKPDSCSEIYEIDINDVSYDEYDEELGYGTINIKNEDKKFDFTGKLDKTSGNRLVMVEPFNPCLK